MTSDVKMKTALDMAKTSPFAHHLTVSPIRESYMGSGKLSGKVALITGGDSGIGRSVAVHFAREGADIAIVYNLQDEEAEETQLLVEKESRQCLIMKGDIAENVFCIGITESMRRTYGRLDILVNNAGLHEEDKRIEEISVAQLIRTFDVNVFAIFFLHKQP